MKKQINRKIYYLNAYTNDRHCIGREKSIAANNKIEYILSSIPNDFRIYNLSLAQSKSGACNRVIVNEDNIVYHYSPSLSASSKYRFQFIKAYWLCFLLFKVRRSDSIIVYHSIFWIKMISVLKRIKKFRLILEINDFYQFYYKGKQRDELKHSEEVFFRIADNYILANPRMKLSLPSKRSLVNYGAYKVVEETDGSSESNIINVLYSGIVERMRNAAFLAIESVLYLPENYKLHMACFGTEEDIKILKKRIKEINEELNRHAIVFRGTLSTDSLNELMCACDISLNCHSYIQEEAYFADYSFPSKIPVNMGAGLIVVSSKIGTIDSLPFDEAIVYFEKDNPKDIADAIKKCKHLVNKRDVPKRIIRKLDEDFRDGLQSLLSEGASR